MTTTDQTTEWTQVGTVPIGSGYVLIGDAMSAGPRTGGVVLESGLGDGHYPVEVRYEADQFGDTWVAEVRIRFLPHPHDLVATEEAS